MNDTTHDTRALVAQASQAGMVEPRDIIDATFQTAMKFTSQGAKDIGTAMHGLKETFVGMGIRLRSLETGTDEDQQILRDLAKAVETARKDNTAAQDELRLAEKKSFLFRASAIAKANAKIAEAEVALQEANKAFKKAQEDIAQEQHDRIKKDSLEGSIKRIRELMHEVKKMSEEGIVLIDKDLEKLIAARLEQNNKLLEYAETIETADATLVALKPELVSLEASLAVCKPNTQAFFQAENAVRSKKDEIRKWEVTLTKARTLLPKVKASSLKNEQQQDMKQRHREGTSLALAELEAVLEDE